MSEVRVEDLAKHVGETVTVRGWLYHRRSSGKLHFLEVRDGSGTVQVVVSKQGVTPEAFALADHIGQESSVEVVGTVKEHGRIKGPSRSTRRTCACSVRCRASTRSVPRSTGPTS